jgi:hypothetical protein
VTFVLQRIAFALAFVCAVASTVPAASKEEFGVRGGLRNNVRRPLSAQQLQTLLESLRHKTGLTEMRFDENGFLVTGDTNTGGGSAVARELMLGAIDGTGAFELERYDNSPDIAFARLVPMEYRIGNDPSLHQVGLIQVDFADFTLLRGSADVLASFEPGLAVIHELVHGILGLKDALDSKTKLGDCDEYVNRIRRDLGLPERQHYSPDQWRRGLVKPVTLAQVSFVRLSDGRRFHLKWDAGRVSAVSTPRPGERAVLAQPHDDL